MSLEIYLDGVPARGRAASVCQQVKAAVSEGRLLAGDRLPTSRELAGELGLARSTVTTVYGRLIAEGYLEGRVGDGTFVTGHGSAGNRGGAADVPLAAPEPVGTPDPVPDGVGVVADLRTGRPDPHLFPLVEWRRCVSSALRLPPPGYGAPGGAGELRRAIATWVHRSRGVAATPEDVIVTAGAQAAFTLCARVLFPAGGVVAVENPGYGPFRLAMEQQGVTVVPVAVDGEGLVVERVPAGVGAVYVTPSHQAPSGAVLSPRRRRELLALAVATDAVIIEDDYDTELRYVDRPLEPLHRLDRERRVVYVGSFSKTLSPSLRLGFVVAPRWLGPDLVTPRHAFDLQPPHLLQVALAELMTTGGYERHLRRARRRYRTRRDLVLDRLDALHRAGLVPQVPTCNAGLHVTIGLGDGMVAREVVESLARSGVVVGSTAGSWIGEAPPELAIGFGLADETALEAALNRLAATLAARHGTSTR